MKIEGVLKNIPRVKVPCPNDGVHVCGKDGEIKGVRNVMIGDKLVPKGMVGFYWQLNDAYGLKVFMHLPKDDNKIWLSTKEYVKKIFKILRKLYEYDLCPQPIDMGQIWVEIKKENKQWIKQPYYIRSEHVNYLPSIWTKYGEGYPYDWKAIEHEDHNPEGFLRFVNRAKKTIATIGLKIDTSFKLGDVLWDINKKRWYLCDCG